MLLEMSDNQHSVLMRNHSQNVTTKATICNNTNRNMGLKSLKNIDID